ncbi:hypothetical protein HCG51_12735 [Tolypothrix sp. PCC 7910]|nr:hypothetical protein [Tolypothrix sp. PCC 7910]QIR37488.1 hypothetical protein HCG51_12735 [Tolypothrix sp. PCC 7910]
MTIYFCQPECVGVTRRRHRCTANVIITLLRHSMLQLAVTISLALEMGFI